MLRRGTPSTARCGLHILCAASRESLPVVSWRRRCALHFGKMAAPHCNQELRPVGDVVPIDYNFPNVPEAFINGLSVKCMQIHQQKQPASQTRYLRSTENSAENSWESM